MLRSLLALVDLVIGIGLIVAGIVQVVTGGFGSVTPVVAWMVGGAFIAFALERRMREARPGIAKLMKGLAGVLIVAALAVYFLRPHGTKPGEPCSGKVGSCNGKEDATDCQDGKVMRVACRGPKGCFTTKAGLGFQCDTSVAMVGDRCLNSDEGRGACSPDKRTALQCKGHVYEVIHVCDGAEGCRIADGQLRCAFLKDGGEEE